jgi:hypothetical protein
MLRISRHLALISSVAVTLSVPVAAQTVDALAQEAVDWIVPGPEQSLTEVLGPVGDEILPDLPIPDGVVETPASGTTDIADADWQEFGLTPKELAQATPLDPADVSGDSPPQESEAAAPSIAALDPPADWTWYTLSDTRFALPPGWTVMEQNDDLITIAQGELRTRPPKGRVIMVGVNDDMGVSLDEFLQDMKDEGFAAQDQGEISISGDTFDWVDIDSKIGGLPMILRVHFSRGLYGEDQAPVIMGFGGLNGELPPSVELREQVLATLRLGTKAETEGGTAGMAVSEIDHYETAFDKIVTMPLITGWEWEITDVSATFTAPISGKQVSFLYGPRAIAALGKLEPRADFSPVWQGGHGAREFAIKDGSLYVWETCPDVDHPLVMQMTGPDGFDSGPAYVAILTNLGITMPEDALPCGETIKPGRSAQSEQTAIALPSQSQSQTQPQPAPSAAASSSAAEAWGEDVFENDPSGYTLYKNARYGFSISYPGTYFTADPPSGNGDGRRFVSVDGQAHFLVYAQYEVLGRDLDQSMLEDRQSFAQITFERVEPGAYQLSGLREGQTVLRRVLRDHDDMTRIFEITYPTARHGEFQAVAAHMAASFAPPPVLAPAPIPVPQPPSAIAVPQPPAQIAVPQPQIATPPNTPTVGQLYTPARGTGERAALMDAARVPIVPAIGQRVIFVVDVLNSDGHWAYLQATPVNPDGTRLNWSRTNFARDWAADVMSDVVMVLMRNQSGQWHAVDWVVGPTDVAWYDWVTRYGLPERLFWNR